MTPRQLKYFCEIANARSFTRAAGILHVAQPALSRQIQQLEDDVGVKLFERTDSGVLLTGAGEFLLQRAPALLEQHRNLRDEVAALAEQPAGRLEVGLPPSLFGAVTVPLVLACTQRFPALNFGFVEGVSADLHEAVTAGRLDMAIVSSTEAVTALHSRPLVREPMVLLSRGSRGLGAPIALEELDGLRLASTRTPNAVRRLVEEALAAAGVRTNFVLESSSARLLLAVAESGWAGTVLPYSAAAESLQAGRLGAQPVAGLSIGWMVVYARNRSTRNIEAVQGLVADVVRSQVEAGHWPGAVLEG